MKPEFSGGYTPRLRKQEWDQVVAQIKGKGYDIEQVSALILKQKAVHYSYEMVWYKLRKEYKLPYGKPYLDNEKMPKDAGEQIQKK